jgi:two-component system probable response regulator PhcQ
MYHILAVDDEPLVLSALKRSLIAKETIDNSASFQVETHTDPNAALQRLEETAFDAVLSDYRMPAMNGVDFLSRVRVIQPDVVRIILSGYTDLNALVSAVNQVGIARFISKPWVDYELKATLIETLKARELLIENQRLADIVRVERGLLSRHEAELRRLEKESPGITHVKWGSAGEVLFEDMTAEELREVEQLIYPYTTQSQS